MERRVFKSWFVSLFIELVLVVVLNLAVILQAMAWKKSTHAGEAVWLLDGEVAQAEAETRGRPFLMVSDLKELSAFDDAAPMRFREITFGYGDTYICGLSRDLQISIDGTVQREPDTNFLWFGFRKVFYQTHFGEVLTRESFVDPAAPEANLAARLLTVKDKIIVRREADDCGDSGVFVFRLD